MTKDDAIWVKEVFYPHYHMTTMNSKTMVGYYECERRILGLDKPNVRGCSCQWRHVGRVVHNLLELNEELINKLYAESKTPTKRGRKKTSVEKG